MKITRTAICISHFVTRVACKNLNQRCLLSDSVSSSMICIYVTPNVFGSGPNAQRGAIAENCKRTKMTDENRIRFTAPIGR